MVIQRYLLNKQELKLIKLNSKAQECTSREQAQKILHKHRKKITKISEAEYRRTRGRKFPQST